MDKRRQKHLEKTLLAILGRRPDLFGVVLDKDGWLPLKELHKALMDETSLRYLTPRSLKQSLALYLPEKFDLRENMVRAKPGYRADGLTEHIDVSPPEDLFICVRPTALEAIRTNGLRPASTTRWIVLARDKEMAFKMGRRRHNNPVLVEIRAALAHERGITFLRAGELLYLAREIPRSWIKLPYHPAEKRQAPVSGPGKRKTGEKRETNGASKATDAMQHAGSFFPKGMVRISGNPAKLIRQRKRRKDKDKSRRKGAKGG